MRRRTERWLTAGWCVGLSGLAGCGGTAPTTGTGPEPTPGVGPTDGGQSNLFALTVARHADEPFSDEAVDGVFAIAGRLLQKVQNGCTDVATNVTFARSGAVRTFDHVPDVITTEQQLDDLLTLSEDIKIVHAMVGVCGISIPTEVATILGCATTGGSLVIVSGAPADVWAHEWGHVQGLGHRDDCPRNLMHSFEIETNAVNERESEAFLTPTPGGATRRFAVSTRPERRIDRLLRATEEDRTAWLDRITGRRYLAGIPSGVAADCDADTLSLLRARCRDPARRIDRRNAMRLLGLAGDAEDCPIIISQVLAPVGAQDRVQFDAVAEAFLALGRIAEHDPSGAALDFLIAGADPMWWGDQDLDWRFGPYEGERLHRLLARLAMLALGLSSQEAALNHLRELRRGVAAGWVSNEFSDQIDEAIARTQGDDPSPSRGRVRQP